LSTPHFCTVDKLIFGAPKPKVEDLSADAVYSTRKQSGLLLDETVGPTWAILNSSDPQGDLMMLVFNIWLGSILVSLVPLGRLSDKNRDIEAPLKSAS